MLTVEGHPFAGQPVMLSEFGGTTFSGREGDWGYGQLGSAEEFAQHYRAVLEAVRSSELLAGFCYTQFADTFQEANGLLYMDRTPKFPIEEIASATRGPGHAYSPVLDLPDDEDVGEGSEPTSV
jgi:hypothetical protein